jgi:D-alanyl-D-alanine carboxypeptidase/D-alanyl-D-alanine-endopeptidase (penicillin-binding protein 4)
MKHYRQFFLIILTLTSCEILKSQQTIVSNKFSNIKKELLENPAIQKGQVSWCFRDILTGQIVEEHESKKYMIPASTLKLFTTAAALQLGIDFKFENKVSYSGEIRNGKLKGNLIIKGNGDPSFGSGKAGALSGDSVLFYIYKTLTDSNIKKIKGNIVIDPFYFEYNSTVIPNAWQWEDIGNYYGAGAYGLNWRGNQFEVNVKGGVQPSDSVSFTIQKPFDKFIRIENNLKTTINSENSSVTFFGAPFDNKLTAQGEVVGSSENFAVSASLPNPPLNFGQELFDYLIEKGIEMDGEIVVENTSLISVKRLKVFESPPMREIIKEINFNSNNLFAECVAKNLRIGYISGSASENYSKNLSAYVFNSLSKKDSSFQITDGSGLSRTNLVTTRMQTDFLRTQTKGTWFGYYVGSIPKGGEEGSVKFLPKMRDFRVKSGSLNKVKAFAGYMQDSSGRQLSFSIIFNHVPLKNVDLNKISANFLSAAGSNNFELPLKAFGTYLYRDTLDKFLEIITAKEEIKKHPDLYFSQEEIKTKRISEKFDYIFRGEPDIEMPYFIVTAEAGGELNKIKFKYRIHAENRFAEKWNASKNEWEMICWGDVFYKR